MKRKVLGQGFFNRPAEAVAQELVGKVLVRKVGKRHVAVIIIETEAYVGPHDRACHAYKGKTQRTEVMFGPAGRWYVYLVYGMHHMLNVVTERDGYPAAVLIRAAKTVDTECPMFLDGPGKLTKALHVDKRWNGKPADRKSGLWIEDRLIVAKAMAGRGRIVRTPRIGVAYTGEWAKKPLRFVSHKGQELPC